MDHHAFDSTGLALLSIWRLVGGHENAASLDESVSLGHALAPYEIQHHVDLIGLLGESFARVIDYLIGAKLEHRILLATLCGRENSGTQFVCELDDERADAPGTSLYQHRLP